MHEDSTIADGARDRAIGALLGLAIGDAVGTTLEFKSPGSFTPITDMVGGGPFTLPAGYWTDDTSMAMCMGESLLDVGDQDPADQLRRYVAWWRTGYWSATDTCFDIGNTTVRALSRFEQSGELTEAMPHEDRAANGSLMRLAPVPIRWHSDVLDAAERSAESSRTTHPASRPTDCCRVYGAMIAALIQGASADQVLDPGFWEHGPLHPEVEAVARGSWRDRQPPEIRGTGYSVDALEAALWAVGGATGFRDAVLRAANLGDDADTTAAIAGQLAGARWGATGIPAEWRGKVARSERITAIAGRLFDADSGSEPGSLWPHDEFIHGYWLYPGRVLAGEYPGNLDAARARERVNLLVDHGIRTFVDLTTPHDGLEPYALVLDEVAEQRRLDLVRIEHPIPDMGVIEHDDYDHILTSIRQGTERGGVYVHCWGGIGRTGTVIGCLLIEDGCDADSAVSRLRDLRSPTRKISMAAPQTEDQHGVLRARAAARGQRI